MAKAANNTATHLENNLLQTPEINPHSTLWKGKEKILTSLQKLANVQNDPPQ